MLPIHLKKINTDNPTMLARYHHYSPLFPHSDANIPNLIKI